MKSILPYLTVLSKSFLTITLMVLFAGMTPSVAGTPEETEANAIALSFTKLTENSFEIRWPKATGVTHYKLWVMYKSEGSSEFVPLVYDGEQIAGSAESFFADRTQSRYEGDYDRKVILKSYYNSTELDRGELTYSLKLLPKITSVTNVTSDSFVVNWLQPEGAEADHRITVRYIASNGAWAPMEGYPKVISKPISTHKVTGLDANYRYGITLERKNGTSYTDYYWYYVTTAPLPPVARAASEISPNSFKANWDLSGKGIGYHFFLKEKVSGKFLIKGITLGAVNSYVAGDLESGLSYEYYLTAFHEDGESGPSNVITVTTVKLAVPVAQSATNVTSASFTARWSSVAGATGYILQYSTGEVWRNISVTGTSYLMEDLGSSTTYEYRVRAVFANGESAPSNVITVKTKPMSPVVLAATNVTTTSFTANWKAVPGATGYKLWVFSRENTGSNPAGYMPKTLGNVLSATLSGLIPGHGYNYAVQVVTADGESLTSSTMDVDTKPLAPVANSATDILTTSFTAGWGAVTGATSYKLYVWKKEGLQFVTGYNGKTVNGTQEAVTGLVPGTGYQYRVSALKNTTASDYSNTISVTTTAQQISTYTVSLSAQPAAGGTVSGGGTFNEGTSVTAHAAPAKGYTFINWTEGGKVVSTSASYLFTVSKDHTLVANFQVAAVTYTVSLSAQPAAGGTVSGGGTFNEGTSVTAHAAPAKGYTFINWTEGGKVVSTSASYLFTVSKDRTLVANFQVAAVTYTVSLSAQPAAGGTVSGGGTFSQGTSVTVTATPAAGYDFVNWTQGTSVLSTSPEYTFSITGNLSFTANFTVKTPVNDLGMQDIRLFPNPVSQRLTISGLQGRTNVSLVTITGSKVMVLTGEGSELQADVSGLVRGIYLVVIETGTGRTTRKITVR
jgi:uncharacterized repeat protein (TIGR02543 family)